MPGFADSNTPPDAISILPWRVKFEGNTVAALPDLKAVEKFVSKAWDDDLTGITIHFVLEQI